MSEDQKYTGNKDSVFQNIGHKIAGLFHSKNKQKKYDNERSQPVFPPAGQYEGKKHQMDNGHTVVFTENEIKSIENKQNFGDTMFIPGIPGNQKKAKKSAGSLFIPRTKRPNFVLGVILTSFKLGITAIFIVVAVAAGLVLGLANAYLETTPDLDVGKIEDQALSSYVYDQSGNLLATYTGSENRDNAALDEIPLDLQHAVIAIEDIRFYSHNGVDIKRIMGSFVSNLTSNNVQGGSTITQQVIKNSLLTSERSYKRKLQEAYLAIELEKKYTKDQILEAYLNTIPLGGTIYGVKAAAKDYFGKELSQLTLKQMVCLAAVTQYPHAYNPRRATYVAPENLGDLQNRMNRIVENMYAAGFITKEQFDATFVPKSIWDSPDYLSQWKAEMNILEESPSNELYPYPHFIEYVIYDVETLFLRKYGMDDTPQNRAAIENEIRSNGYKIYATIDEDIQSTVQSTISLWENYPAFKNESDSFIENPDGSEIIEPQASSVVIDNSTGYIVALIGSRDTPTSKKTLNRAYQAPMPVGSSIKPITVYGPAFDMGLSPATPIANVPVAIPGWDSETGYPTTSQGTPGPVSIREGIVKSLNIVAARTLMEHVGIENSASYLQKMDFNMENVNYNGVGLALGSSGLTTLEMAGAYACIANEGYYREPVAFTTVVDKDGNTVLDSSEYRHEEQVYKPSTAWLLVDILTEAVERGTGHQAQMENIQVAGKTGTVVENRGVFFSGMTGYYTSTLWVGHDQYKPFKSGTSALNTSAPLWQSYMSAIYANKGLGDKAIINKTAEEEGLVEGSCDAIMGGASVSNIPSNTDYFLNGTQPTKVNDIFREANVCSVSGQLAGPNCPSVIPGYVAVFPEDNPYAIWMKGGGVMNLGGIPIVSGNQTCTVHGQSYRDSINYANSIIGAANSVLQQFAGKLTQSQISEITSNIQIVQSVVGRADSSDEAIVTSANILKGIIDAAQASAAATPTPSTSPPASTAPAETPTPTTTSPDMNQ